METTTKVKQILPPAVIGILGGGQLGLMMALEAKQQGYYIHSYDPNPQASITVVSDRHTTGSFDDETKIMTFAAECDVLTYEFENVSQQIMQALEKSYYLPQGSYALKIASNRYLEINHAQALGLSVPKYHLVNNQEELLAHGETVGYPIVLKTISGGYDGHGQFRFYQKADVETFDQPFEGIAQQWIDFDLEVSVVCTRSNKETICFQPIENQHQDGILKTSIQPARISSKLTRQLYKATTELVASLDYIGTFAVEYFIKGDQYYFNEMACRPHNSGHCTQETYNQSQFKTHLSAICGLPLGLVKPYQAGVMINILGVEIKKARQFLGQNSTVGFYHDYFKTIKLKRKMAHITFISDTVEKAIKQGDNFKKWMDSDE